MKIDPDVIALVLRKLKERAKDTPVGSIDEDAIVREMEAEEDRRKEPPAKKPKRETVLVVADPDGLLAGKELVGWAIKTDEGVGIKTVPERLAGVVAAYRLTDKAKKAPVKKLGDMFDTIGKKIFAAKGLQKQNTVPAFVVALPNALPEAKG